MLSPGRYVDHQGKQHRGEVVFWGEWEAPSRIIQKWRQYDQLPRCLHEPFWEDKGLAGFRQNTDPWVFGDAFIYSNCRQLSQKALQRLGVRSLVLFGSTRKHRFVLDTVFVVGQVGDEFVPAERTDVRVSEAFQVCTIDSLASGKDDTATASLTLYRGASLEEPIEGMYSFVPAMPHEGEGPRFERPVIELPHFINPKAFRGPSGAKKQHDIDVVRDVWERVVGQVRVQGLALATYLETPPKR